MLKTVGPSPVQLSCWEESTSPPEHMHACSHMPTHVQEVTGTHTNTHFHCQVLVHAGAPPLAESQTSPLTETVPEGQAAPRASLRSQQSEAWH